MIKKIVFEVETITPMFLSGADQGKAELRAASIKGLMRYWWRALQAEDDLNKLRDRENGIFGSADEGYGASSFSIRISREAVLKTSKEKLPSLESHKIMVTSRGKTFPINILEYLAYGPYDPKKKFVREYIPSETKFILQMNVFRSGNMNEILKAFYFFELFGGIGSRNRNGFGSFSIINKEEVFKPLASEFSLADPYTKDTIQKIINEQTDGLAYTSFSEGSKLFRSKIHHDAWDKALAHIGKIYRQARLNLEKRHYFDKRQYIGAPLDPFNESFRSTLSRHAKPYFIKIAREDKKYRSYVLYLSSLYCKGLDKDREPINHLEANKKFKEVCNKFNEFLSQNMETIL